MDDLNKLPAEEAADHLSIGSNNNENTQEASEVATSLGDLSDVDTEVDEPLGMLSPSLLAPLLQTENEDENEYEPTPNKVELEAQSSSTDPFASLFDGLVITRQEEQQQQEELEEEQQLLEPEDAATEAAAAAAEEVDEPRSTPVSAPVAVENAEPVIAKEEEDLIAREVVEQASIPEPPQERPPLPPPPTLRPQQQKKNRVHFPDIPGASLLELAHHAESRLAFGSTTATASGALSSPPTSFESPFTAPLVSPENVEAEEEESQAFRKQLLVARLVSRLETSSSKTTTTQTANNNNGSSSGNSNPATISTTTTPTSPSSSSVSTNLAARAFLSPQLEPIFKRGTGAPPNSIPSVLTKYLGIVAVGTCAGSIHVLMPKASGKGPPHLHALEDRTTTGDAVTALALGQHAGGLLLLAGHASGQLRLWETKPVSGSGARGGGGSGSVGVGSGGVTWVLARTVGGVHASAVTSCTVIDGGTITWALSADAHGRLMCHNVNRLLSLTAQALAGFARQWAGGGAAAAAASASSLVSLEAAGQDPGVLLSLNPLGSTYANSSASLPPPGQTITSQQHQHPAKTLHSTAEGSHFLLLVASRAVLLAALSSEGSLSILHIFFPPAAMKGETAGCAAWRLEDPRALPRQTAVPAVPSPPGAQYATHALVVIAWGNSISMYRCALTRGASRTSPQASPSKATAVGGGGGSSTSSPRPAPAPLAPPQILSTFSSEHPVNGLAFIGPLGALVVASAEGEVATEISIHHPSTFFIKEESVEESRNESSSCTVSGVAIEKLNISDWMVVRQLDIPGAASLHGSLATSGGSGGGSGVSGGSDQVLLLTSRGVRVIHLLTWHQRLSTLVGMKKLEEAMLFAVRLYLQATTTLPPSPPPGPSASSSATTTAITGGASGQLWPADRAAASDTEEIARQLLTILHAFIDSKLHTLLATHLQNHLEEEDQEEEGVNGGSNKEAEEEAGQLADIAVNTCFLLSRSEALFDEIAPKFLDSPFSSSFLCQLEPRILADELPSLAPEVMQALVEHFAHSGQLERVERCVLKLDILSLDLNQLIPLCLRHGLYGALIHIFIGALQDYQTPATLLLVAAATATARQTNAEEQERSPLISNHNTTNSASSSNKDRLESSLALQLGYRLLVYLRGCLCGLQYPPGSGHAPPQQQQAMRLHAVTFLLHVNTAMLLDTWQLWASVAHLDTQNESSNCTVTSTEFSFSSLPSILHDPSPVLRYLCQMDAPAVLGVLCDGLKGWDALESDLIDLSPELGPLILSVTQGSSNTTSNGSGGRTITQAAVDAVVQLLHEDKEHHRIFKNDDEAALLKFVAEHLAAQRASAEDAVLLRVLRFLVEEEEKEEGKPLGGGGVGGVRGAGKKSNALSLSEKEAIFKDIVVHIHSNHNTTSSSGGGQLNSSISSQVRGEAIDLARKAGYRQAEARIRHAERAFSQAFTCLVEDGIRYPLAPFQYLRDICFDPGLTESDRNLVKSSALRLAPQLVRIDPGETAAVVAECFPQESHVAVLEGLAPWPDDQFAFLQAAIEGSYTSNGGSSSNTYKRPGSGLSSSTTSTMGPMSPESTLESFRGDPLFAPLLNNKNVSSLYVRLLCRFQPSDVLPFLQAHDTYNVDECLKHCIDHGAREAAAFLLERKGDVQAALKMYLEQVDVANTTLVIAVKEHGVEGIPTYYSSSSLSTTLKTTLLSPGGTGILSSEDASSSLAPPLGPSSLPLLPEFVAARDAMNSAVSMCVRFAQDRMTPINSPVLVEHQPSHEQGYKALENERMDSTATGGSSFFPAGVKGDDSIDFKGDPVRAVWFEVLQRYVTVIRSLRAEEKEQEKGTTPSTTPAATPPAVPTTTSDLAALDRLSCLERVFTAFMEEVISQMAGHVPLHSIAAAVLQKYSGDSFGDFRTTLSSLLGACNFELAILRCASRVTGTDTIALLKQGYKQCMMPQVVASREQENINSIEGGSGTGGGASGSGISNQMSMNAALRSLESAQQIGQDAWAKAAAAAGPAASKLMEKAGFV